MEEVCGVVVFEDVRDERDEGDDGGEGSLIDIHGNLTVSLDLTSNRGSMSVGPRMLSS